jgi:hypothetical protein
VIISPSDRRRKTVTLRRSGWGVFLLVALLTSPHVTLAQDESSSPGRVVPLRLGEAAPFEGTLFDARASARVLAELEHQEALCAVEIDRAAERARLLGESEIRSLTLSLATCEARYDLVTDLQGQEIESLSQALVEAETDYRIWWLTAGVGIGIVVTLGSAWLLSTLD